MPEDRTRTTYNRLAASYDWLWQRYLAQTLSFLHAWAEPRADEVVLDVACGTGLFEDRVVREQPQQRMVGVDLSPDMLTVAAQRLKDSSRIAFHAASAAALPLRSASFDLVVSASALHYFDDPHVALAEMNRALKPGERIVILDWCRDFASMQLLDRLLTWLDPAHRHSYTEAELHDLLAGAGFDVVRARRQRFGLFWGLMIVTARPKA